MAARVEGVRRGDMGDEKTRTKLGPEALGRGLRAALFAWLFPGAGHLALGARRRAGAFLAIIVLTVTLGIVCDGNLAVVDAERAPVLSALQVAGNLALGPVEPLLRAALYGSPVYRESGAVRNATPGRRAALERRSERSFRRFSQYGSAYLMAAGLMNMLLILDAWDLGIRRKS
jgi:hypothetical protein